MQTVSKELWTNVHKIKSSKFETLIIQVTNLSDVKIFLQNYQDVKATHNCFAYIVGFEKMIKKYSDDGEPSKSAGFAILKVLEEKKLTNVIVLVRRYFQPPKLGVGRLMRAYQFGLLEYIKEVKLLAIVPSKKYALLLPVNLINLVYQWQKQYHFLILKQKNEGLKILFIINIASTNLDFTYHSDVEVTFIENSFLASEN